MRFCPSNRFKNVGLVTLLAATSAGHAADFFATDPTQLHSAIRQALPGDTLTMASGTWTNADIRFTAQGAPDKLITLRAQTPGQVVLTGSSRLRLAGSYLAVDGLTFKGGHLASNDVIAFAENSASLANHCRLSNCAIIDYNPTNRELDNKWVTLSGFSNRVDHCYFTGKLNPGAVLVVRLPPADSPDATRPNYHRIDHNYFGPRPDLGQNRGESIRIGDSATSFNVSRTIVEANYFQACNGDAEIVSNKSCENFYRHNTFVDCEGALTLRHGNRCTVEGNFFFGQGKPRTGGVRIIGEDHKVLNNYFQDLAGTEGRSPISLMQGWVNSPLEGYFQVKNALLAFNTLVNCQEGLLIGLADTLTATGQVTTLPPMDCRIANNLLYSSGFILVDQRVTPLNLVWEGNLMFGTTIGIRANPGIIVADPLLVRAGDGLWRPGVGSPALGAAQGEHSFVTTDIDGQERPALKDIGCDQQSVSEVTRKPLTPADVGPEWIGFPIQAAQYLGQQFTFQWKVVPGTTYQVQFSADLVSWLDSGPAILTTNSIHRWTDDAAGSSSRFYRVKRLP
jgi:poly(beta-D-mannuronate) lyase